VTNDSSLFIRGCVQVDRTTCVGEALDTTPLQLGGFIDGSYAAQYLCTALVENQLVPRGDPNKLRVETSRVELYEADVQVLNTDMQVISGPSGPAQFSVPVTGFVDPSSGNSPGTGLATVVMLDARTVQNLAKQAASSNTVQQVVASIVIRGRTLGGLEVHTNEFLYPIDVCAGCQCFQPPGKLCVGGMDQPDDDCRLGIDNQVDCRYLGTQDPCKYLECTVDVVTGKSDLNSAHCPAVAGAADGTCCNP
jgi:hypothetical protein